MLSTNTTTLFCATLVERVPCDTDCCDMIQQFLEGTSCPKELSVQGKQLPVNTTAGEAEGSTEIIISEIN